LLLGHKAANQFDLISPELSDHARREL